jgi:putative membrane protein
MNKTILASFIAAGVLGASACHNNQSQDSANMPGDNQTKVSADTINKSDDAKFLTKVAQINLEEIELGKLAQEKGTTQDIKDLGKMMVEEHTKAQNDLVQLAQQKSITVPTSPDANAQDDYTDLNKKSGTDFDKKYCDMMVSGHKDAISLFEKDSAKGTDSEIRQMAVSTLPNLRKHLDHAKMCKDNVKS